MVLISRFQVPNFCMSNSVESGCTLQLFSQCYHPFLIICVWLFSCDNRCVGGGAGWYVFIIWQPYCFAILATASFTTSGVRILHGYVNSLSFQTKLQSFYLRIAEKDEWERNIPISHVTSRYERFCTYFKYIFYYSFSS